MHGYDPRLDSQKAIVVCSVDGIKLPTRAREVYDFLISLGTG
jgi:hypothetical protein